MYGDSNIAYIVFTAIGALLAVVPLPKAMASGNVGISMLVLWTELACLFQFANAIRWNRNTGNWAPAWCDFFAHFLLTAEVAVCGAGTSINRRLYMIVTLDPKMRRTTFNAVVDITVCLVIPLVSIALRYVVRQYRYYVYENIGCLPGIANVDLTFPLVWMPLLLCGTVSTGYACLTIRASFLLQNHKSIEELGESLALNRRVMAIGIFSAIYGLVPPSMAIILRATAYPISPWPGWDAIHSTNDDILYFSTQEWQSSAALIALVELRRWTLTSLTFIIFVVLGLTADMKKMFGMSRRGVVNQASSGSQAGTVPERSTSESSDGHWDASLSSSRHQDDSRTPEKPTTERRESFDVISRPRLDPDVESIDQAFYAAQPFTVQSTSPWKPYH